MNVICFLYLLIPHNRPIDKDAQERLKVIQENSALGSGIKIAQRDLDLRGAGNILGSDQSGHAHLVGHELYLELLEQTLSEMKGEPSQSNTTIEPDINLRIPALIPDSYIDDIRLRLNYYKTMSQLTTPEDMVQIEEDLKDRYGKIPEPVVNLMGIMLIRNTCKRLGVRDISSNQNGFSLFFDVSTPVRPVRVIELTTSQSKKFRLTPDNRLLFRLDAPPTWVSIYAELSALEPILTR